MHEQHKNFCMRGIVRDAAQVCICFTDDRADVLIQHSKLVMCNKEDAHAWYKDANRSLCLVKWTTALPDSCFERTCFGRSESPCSDSNPDPILSCLQNCAHQKLPTIRRHRQLAPCLQFGTSNSAYLKHLVLKIYVLPLFLAVCHQTTT